MFKTITDLCKEAYEIADSKGWHDEPREIGTLLALIHSEVSEALEEVRQNGFTPSFELELADICIRVFDLCALYGINLEEAIEEKWNTTKLDPINTVEKRSNVK